MIAERPVIERPDVRPAPTPGGGGPDPRRPMAQRGSKVLRRARRLGWWTRETVAVMTASCVVTLAALYINAYARLAADGNEVARLEGAVKVARQEREGLTARVSQLTLARSVQARATQMGMVPNTPGGMHLLPAPAPLPTPAAITETTTP